MTWYIKKLNKKIDIHSLREYLNSLDNNFSHLKWMADDNLSTVDSGVGGHELSGVTGYGIQSNLHDITKACPPYNVSKETTNYRDTELVYGIINELKVLFPNSHQYSIASHPPGTFINSHRDSDHSAKIHIPLYTNDSAFFFFGDRHYQMESGGNMYLVNTDAHHGTINKGDTTRVHLFFKIPMNSLDDLLNESTEIDFTLA